MRRSTSIHVRFMIFWMYVVVLMRRLTVAWPRMFLSI
jgi:hypothetical protein